MKKKVILFILLLSTTLASAAPQLTFQNENLQPQETLLATITGPFLEPIEKSDITFYEGRKEVNFQYDLAFSEDNYYLYAYLTKEGNFTLQIPEVLYEQDGLKTKTLEKEFNVTNNYLENSTKTQILSIKPGFIFSNKQETILLINKGTETLNVTYSSQEISLSPEQDYTITTPEESTTISISTYKNFNIPVIFYSLENNTNTTNPNINETTNATTNTTTPFSDIENITESQETCQDLGGEICTSEQTCSGTPTIDSEGEYCCIGSCQDPSPEKEKGSYGWLIGIGIFILLAIIAFFIYKKFKKTKPKQPEEKLEQTKKSYETRIKGGLSRS